MYNAFSSFFSQFTPGAVGIWSVLATLVGVLIRTWPIVKQKLNEARKLELEADGGLRTTLLQRITQLEENQTRDRLEFSTALHDERKRCDEELDEIRARLRAAEEDNRGLMSMIRQSSHSTAMVIGNPGGTAITQAARKSRGEDIK